MKKNILALAGCIAATTPSISTADVLSDNIFGLNLGEISAKSFINQPFKGIIPFLLTSVDNSKNLNIRLAPESIFKKIGIAKLPILNSLNFQITQQDNNPVILISSNLPIQQPFLNFVLEIQGPQGSIYQDYTVLLDPKSKQVTTPTEDYIFDYESVVNQNVKQSADELLISRGTLLLANLSSRTLPSTKVSSDSGNSKYRVKAGDSLSKIAQKQNVNNTSLSTMSSLIYQKNPTAFILGDMNRIKKGALLSLPSISEINGFELAKNETKSNSIFTASANSNNELKLQSKISTETITSSKRDIKESLPRKTYTVAKGDSLSKITGKFISKDISFTKMMNSIFINNPDAFANKSKNQIKAGATISIPSIAGLDVETKQVSKVQQNQGNEITVEKNVPITKLADLESNSDQYQVKAGDNLSIITKKIGYEGVPFAKMLKAIYKQNPDAFVDGNMAELLEGSVITMPPLESIAGVDKVDVKAGKLILAINKKVIQPATPTASVSNTADYSKLIKRIRELRKELKQSKDNLSEMKEHLIDREIILQRKNIQLKALNASIIKSNRSTAPELLAVSAVKTPNAKKVVIEDSYGSISEEENADLISDSLVKENNSLEQLYNMELDAEAVGSATYQDNLDRLRDHKFSSPLAVFINDNSSYLTISLLLGLLLIRYRRELYYKYYAIRYDQPTYYPVPDSDKYELREININYHDAKMDEESFRDGGFLPKETKKESPQSSEIVINPLLVEANEEIFVNNSEIKEENVQIEHCEKLITELLDDLNIDEKEINNSESKDIDKVSDDDVEKIKEIETDDLILETKDGSLENSVANLDNVITDLLKNLDKVDDNIRKHKTSKKGFPKLYIETET